MRTTCMKCSEKLAGDSCPQCGWTRAVLDKPEPKSTEPTPEGMLRYRFPKSTSKRFGEAVERARRCPHYHQDGDEHWVEFLDTSPDSEFRELERISQNWKGAGHFIGETQVTRDTWWSAANPFGKAGRSNVPEDWIDRKLWLDWGKPENLVVGEGFRQGNLRGLAAVDGDVMTLEAFPVTFEREPNNSHDPNAVKAIANGIHVGYLMAERAAIVGPEMDRSGIREMRVAGVLSGSSDLGMHIWPDRLLTDGIMVGDTFRPIPAWYHALPRLVHEEYLAARQFAAQQRAALDRSVAGCFKAIAWMFGLFVFFMLIVLVSIL